MNSDTLKVGLGLSLKGLSAKDRAEVKEWQGVVRKVLTVDYGKLPDGYREVYRGGSHRIVCAGDPPFAHLIQTVVGVRKPEVRTKFYGPCFCK